MMLCPVVCPVGGAGVPEKTELALGFAVVQPVESHVHGFSALCLNVVVHDSEGCGVVGLHGSLWLFVAHFCKCYSLWNCFSCIDIECSQFCLRCRGHNCLDELCKVENSSIVGWVVAVKR